MILNDVDLTYYDSPLGSQPKWRKMPHGTRDNRTCSVHELYSVARLRRVHSVISWRSSSSWLLLSRSVLHGALATDLSQKFPRRRNVPVNRRAKAIPYGVPEKSVSEFVGGCQSRTHRARLQRLCSLTGQPSAKISYRRVSVRETGLDRLRSRQCDSWPLREFVCLGKIQLPQGTGKAARTAAPRLNSQSYVNFSRLQCDHFRSSADQIRNVLRDGARTCRLSKSSLLHKLFSVFRNASQIHSWFQSPCSAAGRQGNGVEKRPDDPAGWSTVFAVVPRPTCAVSHITTTIPVGCSCFWRINSRCSYWRLLVSIDSSDKLVGSSNGSSNICVPKVFCGVSGNAVKIQASIAIDVCVLVAIRREGIW